MKLYVTPTSPYARIVRIVRLEKGLESRIDVVAAATRTVDSPYYRINPSGRVPYLVRDDGIGLEDSSLICEYLDALDGEPAFELPSGEGRWEVRRLEALARSLLDGLAVWGRELRRPPNERSPKVLDHEAARAERLIEVWETEVTRPGLRGPLDRVQITLACALGLEARNPGFQWRPGHPELSLWFDALSRRPSLALTAPEGP